MQSAHPRRWTALAVIALAQFVVIMDTSIIGVALPEIQADLGFTPENLSWVFNAYVIALGGLLLLGGRLSDLLGAKRMFLAGWTVLAGGSLVAGLADSVGLEIAARAIQGADTGDGLPRFTYARQPQKKTRFLRCSRLSVASVRRKSRTGRSR